MKKDFGRSQIYDFSKILLNAVKGCKKLLKDDRFLLACPFFVTLPTVY